MRFINLIDVKLIICGAGWCRRLVANEVRGRGIRGEDERFGCDCAEGR